MTTVLETPPQEQQLVSNRRGLGRAGTLIVRILRQREAQLILAILLVGGISATIHPDFVASGNISFMLADSVGIMVLAIGETIVIIGRGIDLSVAPILGIAAIAVGFPAQNHNLNIFAALALVILIGIALGVGNGLLVSVASLPPIIATLATLAVYGGLQFIFSSGNEVSSIPNSYYDLGSSDVVPGIPWLILIGIGLVVLTTFFLQKTSPGRSIYAIGNNAEAAFRAGIPVRRVLFLTYVLCGLLAGIGGLIYLCHVGSADSTTGSDSNVNLNAIAAALIGGTALSGGRGRPAGAALGAVFLSVALTAMVFLRIPPIWEPAGVGALILLAVVTDRRGPTGVRRVARRARGVGS
jgi:ribose/xylose/arabinose/galactoside ABC-type transport system permease subunit